MSFTLHLGENGVYTKHDGAPLMPCQELMLYDGLYNLPKHWEDEVGEILTARQWRIPAHGFGHFLVIEYLPRDRSKGWPWQPV